MENNAKCNWQELLLDAVQRPGQISRAYTLFHNYSMGNALEILYQCASRGIEPGPINTYPGWKNLGRQVSKGQKALSLWMPVTRRTIERDRESGEVTESTFTRFIYKAHWFVVSQTTGKTQDFKGAPGFDKDRALAELKIKQIAFDHTDGNCQGFARRREIAVSPIADMPHKTTFHEIAHVVLGHTSESALTDDDRTPKSIREVEAESVAMICCEALGLDGSEFSRGYIQAYLTSDSIPEKSAQRIFATASTILKAGQAESVAA